MSEQSRESDLNATTTTSTMMKAVRESKIKWPNFYICFGFLFAFILISIINKEFAYKAVNACCAFLGKTFGGLEQVLMFVFWVSLILLAVSKWGKIRIGGKDAKKSTSNLNWYAVISTTLLAGGGVFFSAAEPLMHFLNTPPHFKGIEHGTFNAASYALAQTYMDWGFLLWGVCALGVPALVYASEIKKLPLRPSSMLYPLLGRKGSCGPLGTAMDGFALIGVAAGTIGPTGFLGLQLSYTLHNIMGIPDSITMQMIVILVATAIFAIGASTGANKGMTALARWTIYLGAIMIIAFFCFNNGIFIIDSFVDAFGTYMREFPVMAFSRDDPTWMNGWTVFYLFWFLSFGPSMAVLIINLSKGRTLRQVLIAITVISPIIANFWFTVFGASGLYYELQTPGIISNVFNTFGMPSVLVTIIDIMPLHIIWLPLAIVLIVLFLVTTGAGVAYSMALQVTNMEVPYAWLRALFSILMGVCAAVLVWIGGSDAMSALQNFMLISGVPMMFFYVMVLAGIPKAAKALYMSRKHRLDSDDEGFIDEKPIDALGTEKVVVAQ